VRVWDSVRDRVKIRVKIRVSNDAEVYRLQQAELLLEESQSIVSNVRIVISLKSDF
jgi:hypothetical protein